MKKLFSLLLCMIIVLSCSFTVFAEEYNNGEISFSLQEDMVRDTKWAEENAYIDCWHTEDYGLEVMLWKDDFTFMVHPSSSTAKNVCHDFVKTEAMQQSVKQTTDVSFNGLDFYKLECSVQNDEESVDCLVLKLKNNTDEKGEVYHLTFFIHDESYMIYIDEIMNSFEVSKSFISAEVITRILFLSCVGIVIVVLINKRRKNKTK